VVTQLAGKTALVTGAASGIGKAAAVALRQAGAAVIGIDSSAANGGVEIVTCNLADEVQIISAVSEAAERLGRIDILINNAGVMQESAIEHITAEHIDWHFAVNVRAAILVTREALRYMGKGGRIVNIASELAYLGRSEASVYCATKGAILGLTRSWARELAPRILVNAVAPGPTDTPLLAFDTMTPEEQARETALPLRRIARPEEIASAVLFLAGPGATYVTGQCLGVNGGAVMP
jgi:3-oxoacyl-[acyl-carrier protein] reductase